MRWPFNYGNGNHLTLHLKSCSSVCGAVTGGAVPGGAALEDEAPPVVAVAVTAVPPVRTLVKKNQCQQVKNTLNAAMAESQLMKAWLILLVVFDVTLRSTTVPRSTPVKNSQPLNTRTLISGGRSPTQTEYTMSKGWLAQCWDGWGPFPKAFLKLPGCWGSFLSGRQRSMMP